MRVHETVKYVAGIALAAIATSVALVSACSPQQSEGARCNAGLAAGETDCASGLACTQPSLCPENYCCPVDSKGNATPSTNSYCQTGCNGGAASICNASPGADDGGACAFACQNDPSDLMSTAMCGSAADAGADAVAEGGAGDSAADASDASSSDAGDASSSDAGDSSSSDASDAGVADSGNG
jgi:hypothetical protein